MNFRLLFEQIEQLHTLDNVAAIKECVQNSYSWLSTSFKHEPINLLVTGRSQFVDALLVRLWQLSGLERVNDLALCAVGGYGRGHLHPYSDIDLLIVSKRPPNTQTKELISQFITLLWDIRLDVGQSVRTIKETVKLANEDISIATNLVESRLLIGNENVFNTMWHDINRKSNWSSKAFFIAKYEEQKSRHAKFNDTSYNLEPNVKENPGCLRDIQSIGWVAKKHFQEYDGINLVGHGYFTNEEHQELVECRMQLWRIRFALHLVAGRSENRLLFDFQPQVAKLLGYSENEKASVEKMMKSFFRTVRRVSELNKMLLQRFNQEMLQINIKKSVKINDDFSLNDGLISPVHQDVFSSPEAILDFLELIACTPEVKGLDSDCIRYLRNARRAFQDEYYVKRPSCRKKIMVLFEHPNFFDFAWDVMYQYGILQSYLPQWDHIVGMMQFDLFHAYTVDEHTHRIVKFINQYANGTDPNFSRCTKIMQAQDKPELLYITAIFHDIAKGRNGDHSALGAKDVLDFCELHHIEPKDAALISWLVENHLLMSVVAQRRDIYDPDVVTEFASAVRSHVHLDLLYALTLADIRATNNNLWNDWKASLLRELYLLTRKALDNGLQCAITIKERANTHKEQAIKQLEKINFNTKKLESELWNRFEDDYFARFKPEQIAWHSQVIMNSHVDPQTNLIVKTNSDIAKGGTEILIYGPDRPALFAQVASVMDSRNCTIQDAHIMVTKDGYVFDSMIISDSDGQRFSSTSRIASLENAIFAQVAKPDVSHSNNRKLSRQHKQLEVPVKIRFYQAQEESTLIELEALDAPGILAKVGHAFVDCNLTLKLAKISTIGERAEDIFIVSSTDGKALTQDQQVTLKKQILLKLNQLEDIHIP